MLTISAQAIENNDSVKSESSRRRGAAAKKLTANLISFPKTD
jgi:hypothetical protein